MDIFGKIKEKNEKEIKEAADKRVNLINSTRDKVIEVLMESDLTIQDTSLCLQAIQHKISKTLDKKLGINDYQINQTLAALRTEFDEKQEK